MSEETTYLPPTVSVDRDGLSGFDSAEHVALHVELCERMEAAEGAMLHFPAGLLERWKESVGKEVGNGLGRRASALTKQLEELDRERVKTLVYLFGTVSGQLRSPIEARREAAERLAIKLRPFKKIRRSISRLVRTGDIASLRLHLAELPADVETLDLKQTLEQLGRQNEEYQALIQQRSEEERTLRRPPMMEVRPQTDEAYTLICRYVEASYLFATREEREKIYDLVLHLNRTTARHRAGHRESQTKRRLARQSRKAAMNEAADKTAEGEA